MNVGIIEDDHGIRATVSEFLNMQDDIACVFESDNVGDFLAKTNELTHLDVLLLDINLPDTLGIEAIVPIKKALPRLEIIMLTIHSSSEMVFKALCAGASGYLLKTTKLPEIAAAVQAHFNGGSAMSPSIARMVVQRFNPTTQLSEHNQLQLTPREMQVIQALADGLSYKLIADRLQMSVKTLPVHIRNIYKKLQINSKAEAIAIYLKRFR